MTCSDCSAPISAQSTGRCRRCANARRNASPKQRAAVRAYQLRAWQTPKRRYPGRIESWCPPEQVRHYKSLRSHYGAKIAREIILLTGCSAGMGL